MAKLEIERLTRHIGARVSGVDPRELDAKSVGALHAALVEHEVLFFRGLHLSDAEHLALAARFGTPSLFPMQRVLGDPEPRVTAIVDGPDSPPGADDWHTDVTWTAEPPKFAFLRAIAIPEVGGDTLWASMTAAYAALSEPVRRFFEGLEVAHDKEHFVAAVLDKMGEEAAHRIGLVEKLDAHFPPVVHPLVRTHPDTGKRSLLFGGRFMKAVVGLTAQESDALLSLLHQHVADPRFQCRWRWRAGDLAIWDERSTIHRALGDHFPAHREVRRITVDGVRPSLDARAA